MKLALIGLIVFYIRLCLADGGFYSYQLTHEKGAVCNYIDGTAKRPGAVALYVNDISTTDESILETLKFPVLIFRYTEILKLANIPRIDDYYSKFAKDDASKSKLYEGVVDFEKLKFDLSPYKDSVIDESLIYNDYIKLDQHDGEDPEHVDVVLQVKTSGVYCIYIAPPPEGVIKTLSLPIKFSNGSGYLSALNYLIYSQQKYFVLVGSLIFGYLFYYILRFKVGTDYQDMNSISIISKGVIFFALLPFILFSLLQLIFGFLENNFLISAFHGYVFRFLKLIGIWLNLTFASVMSFLILLFCMGYGVVYYHQANSRNYRILPQRQRSVAIFLLITDFVLSTILILLSVATFGSSTESGGPNANIPYLVDDDSVSLRAPSTSGGFLEKAYLVTYGFHLFVPAVWFFLTLYYYFQTKKIISKFSPIPRTRTDGLDETEESNEKIVTSFKRSIYAIFILPAFVAFAMVVVMVLYVMKSGLDPMDNSSFLNNASRPDMQESATVMYMVELQMNSSNAVPLLWTSAINFFLKIICLFYIWIKDNNGLIVDSGLAPDSGFGEISQFDVESEEEEEHR